VAGRDARERVMHAALMTATDALNQAAMRFDQQRGRVRELAFGGLRGGTVRGVLGDLRLRRAVYVSGVAVSGRARPDRYDLRVHGRGTLRVRGSRVTGTLGGVRVRAVVDRRAVGSAGVPVERIL
jgi:hypothetical protein